MMAQAFPLRMIRRLEAYLPVFAPADPARQRRGWLVFAGTVLSLIVAGTQLAVHRSDVAEIWPVWRPMLLDVLLIVAGAALVAAVAAGAVAWRTAGRHHA